MSCIEGVSHGAREEPRREGDAHGTAFGVHTMAFVEWTSQMSVGIDSIDKQHLTLVALINELHEAMKTRQAHDVLSSTFANLVDYTRRHFEYEEQLFKKHGYAGGREHAQRHQELTDTVVALKEKFESGSSALSIELLDFLYRWLVDHIQGTDKGYASYLFERGVR